MDRSTPRLVTPIGGTEGGHFFNDSVCPFPSNPTIIPPEPQNIVDPMPVKNDDVVDMETFKDTEGTTTITVNGTAVKIPGKPPTLESVSCGEHGSFVMPSYPNSFMKRAQQIDAAEVAQKKMVRLPAIQKALCSRGENSQSDRLSAGAERCIATKDIERPPNQIQRERGHHRSLILDNKCDITDIPFKNNEEAFIRELDARLTPDGHDFRLEAVCSGGKTVLLVAQITHPSNF